MEYKILILSEKIFARDIWELDKQEQELVKKKIYDLKTHGISIAQVKRLKNYPVAQFRLRIGNYRLLFNFDITTNTFVLIRILHRSKLY